MAISTDSIWLSKTSQNYPTWNKKESSNIPYDVVIIGGGIAGVTTAYLLSKTKLKIALIEKNKIAQGATGYTTAMITQYIDTDLMDLVKMYGDKKAKLIWQAGGDAIDLIEQIIKKEKIDCEFKRVSYFILGNNDQQKQSLLKEKEVASQLGIKMDFKKDKLVLSNQAKFHPVKYIQKLAEIAAKNSVDVFEKSEVTSIDEIKAKKIIITTHLPLNKPFELFFKKAKYKTYMIYAKLPRAKLQEALYQDSDNPYHYFRIDKHETYDTILLGGEDHRADIPVNPERNYKSLEKYLQKLVPKSSYKILNQWDGPIIETIDGLPYIGALHSNKNTYYATGFSGNGMIWGTLSGMILSDLVKGKNNKYYDQFRASRIPTIKQLLFKGKDYAQIFFGGVIKNIFK